MLLRFWVWILGWCLEQWLRHHLQCLNPMPESLVGVSAPLPISVSCCVQPGRAVAGILRNLDPCHPNGKATLTSWILASAWHSPIYCRSLEEKRWTYNLSSWIKKYIKSVKTNKRKRNLDFNSPVMAKFWAGNFTLNFIFIIVGQYCTKYSEVQ